MLATILLPQNTTIHEIIINQYITNKELLSRNLTKLNTSKEFHQGIVSHFEIYPQKGLNLSFVEKTISSPKKI